MDIEGAVLLGQRQLDFLEKWVEDWQRAKLKVVLSATIFCGGAHIHGSANGRLHADMDSNGWPQSARNRALEAIQPSQAVMLAGDIHFGTLHQHGVKEWGDGPWGYSVPAFASKQNRKWGPAVAAQGGEIEGIDGSGNHHDRFGNKLTVAATAPGANGYGIVRFNKSKMTIICELHSMNSTREPDGKQIPGWPHRIQVVHE